METTIYGIARRIPAEIRRTLLTENYIYKAVADASDRDMQKLFIIYGSFIEPDNAQYKYRVYDGMAVISDCRACLAGVIEKFKTMERYLIQLEREDVLLGSLDNDDEYGK